MRHRKHIFRVGRKPAHVKALLANQVCSLIMEGRIQTTVAKAKETRRLAEKMITLGKRGTLHHRRRAIAKLRNIDAVRRLFNEIAPQYRDRSGGYTRIIRIGFRNGDGAPTCFLEFVEAVGTPSAVATDADLDVQPVAEDDDGATAGAAADEAGMTEVGTEAGGDAAEHDVPAAGQPESVAEADAGAPQHTADDTDAPAEPAPPQASETTEQTVANDESPVSSPPTEAPAEAADQPAEPKAADGDAEPTDGEPEADKPKDPGS
jgi:large subunit ribosomal protein L17